MAKLNAGGVMVAKTQSRYVIHEKGNYFLIRDMRMNDYCSLDGENPLRWLRRRPAQEWLDRCYKIWEFRPLLWDEPPPRETWGRPGRRVGTDTSPWVDFTTPVNDSRFGA
jgi:hypothetical protein